MAHFIYATDIAPRVMFAPAGYFCTACPTVVVDEHLIATGMKAGYRFRAVVGVDGRFGPEAASEDGPPVPQAKQAVRTITLGATCRQS
jgi:hypothetical protein